MLWHFDELSECAGAAMKASTGLPIRVTNDKLKVSTTSPLPAAQRSEAPATEPLPTKPANPREFRPAHVYVGYAPALS